MTAPARLPSKVRIVEVGPRDGLQNEATVVPVEVKAEFVRRLLGAGLRTVELTSFVPAKWVPQLADAEELLARLGELPGRHPVLVPTDARYQLRVDAIADTQNSLRDARRTTKAEADAIAVMSAIAGALPASELDYVRAAKAGDGCSVVTAIARSPAIPSSRRSRTRPVRPASPPFRWEATAWR